MVDVNKLGYKGYKVYLYLKYSNDPRPSIKKIADSEDISLSTVCNAIAKLKKMKYLKIRRMGRAKYYWYWPDKK